MRWKDSLPNGNDKPMLRSKLVAETTAGDPARLGRMLVGWTKRRTTTPTVNVRPFGWPARAVGLLQWIVGWLNGRTDVRLIPGLAWLHLFSISFGHLLPQIYYVRIWCAIHIYLLLTRVPPPIANGCSQYHSGVRTTCTTAKCFVHCQPAFSFPLNSFRFIAFLC